jgi:AcrR family transcriptional regulator
MGGRRATKEIIQLDEESIPEWQRQSMRRSLQSMHRSMQSARVRAHARSEGFVAAATELMKEKGNTDFTVQDVVDRSRMSIRTFYKYFASKEDLLVAVHETVLTREVIPRLRKRIDKFSDPLLRLRAYIEGLIELTAKPGRVAQALTSYQNRLAESRPADLTRAIKPQFDLLMELVKDVSRTQPLHRDLTVETAARLVHYTVLSAVHARVQGAAGAYDVSAASIWHFCASGMGFGVGSPAIRLRR